MKWLNQLQQLDERSYLWLCMAARGSFRTSLARAVSMSGDGWLYALIALALMRFDPIHGKTLLFTLMLAFAVEVPLYVVLKNVLKRQRPYQRLAIRAVITASDKFSFPSGHTTAAFMFCAIVGAYFPHAFLLLMLWATAVGVSRVALGVHYVTDIVAGALLGLGLAYCILAIIPVVI